MTLAPLLSSTPSPCASCARTTKLRSVSLRNSSTALRPKQTAPPPRKDSPNPASSVAQRSMHSDVSAWHKQGQWISNASTLLRGVGPEAVGGHLVRLGGLELVRRVDARDDGHGHDGLEARREALDGSG
eukprot:scaffold3356_cov264-Pinguiococcus_pyrenoidosus.AAC.16